MIYVMSDLHGCYDQYERMLKKISFSKDDVLYILGDVVDRGPDGMKILLDIAKRENVILFRGNHDHQAEILLSNLHCIEDGSFSKELLKELMNVYKLWLSDGGRTTLEEYLLLSEEEREIVHKVLRNALTSKEIEVNGKPFLLAHTVPEVDIICDYEKWTLEDYILGEPDYEEVYFEDKYVITGHTATDMLENKSKIEECKKKFNVPKPLECYITLGNIANGKTVYDLRYLGQSVGEIHIKNEEPVLVVSEKKAEASKKYFGYEIGNIDNELWSTGNNAKAFRTFYKKVVDKEKFPRQKEHMVEARLFQELSKTIGMDKQLKYIQPIKFAGCFTHMKTAVAACKSKDGEISVTNAGGEIDVFCRRKVSPRESRLTVIEVKDKVERNESFEEAMFQAVSYAVFVRELIHSSDGNKWMQIWGMNNKKTDGITINAVVAIPTSDEKIPNFNGQKIVLENDVLDYSDKEIQLLLKYIDSITLTIALKGVKKEVADRFFRNMSLRFKCIVQEDMEYMGPLRMCDVEDAQKKILQAIKMVL